MQELPAETPGRLGLEVVRAGAIPFAFGLAAQSSQVVLAREFLTVFHGNELSVALVFGLWLFWVAVGTALGALLARRVEPRRLIAVAAFAQLLCLPAAVVLIRGVRGWFDVATGQYLPLGGLALASGAVLALPCAVFGAQFAWAVKIAGNSGRTYAFEGAGAALGAVAVTVLVPWVDAFVILAVSAACLFAACGGKSAWLGFPLCVGLAISAESLERRTRKSPVGALLETVRSPHGSIAVVERGGDVSIYRSGRLSATLPERGESAPIACVAMLQHPKPRRVLLAGGSATLLPEVLRHGVERVDVVELDERIFGLVRRYDPQAIDDSRVRRHGGDARRFLKSAERYDVVLVPAGEPDTALSNRFYTAEFFRLARERCDVLVVGALAASSGSDELLRRNATIFRTLVSVFPGVIATPSGWLLASERLPLTLDESEIGSRAESRGRGDVNIYDLTRRFDVEKAQAEFASGTRYDPLSDAPARPAQGEVNTDARPVGYFESLRAWAWQAGDRVGRLLGAGRAVPFWLILALFSLPAVAGRRGVSMFHVGFAGMALSLGVLLSFHASVGYLQSMLGLLIGSFMLGSAAGAVVRVPPRPALLAVSAVGTGLILVPGGPWVAALLPLAGLAVGACYGALADPKSAARLYALDVAGGCAAAFLAVPLLLPLHGAAGLGALSAIPCAAGALFLRRR